MTSFFSVETTCFTINKQLAEWRKEFERKKKTFENKSRKFMITILTNSNSKSSRCYYIKVYIGKKSISVLFLMKQTEKKISGKLILRRPYLNSSLFLCDINTHSSLHYLKWYERLSAFNFGWMFFLFKLHASYWIGLSLNPNY